MDRRYEVFCVTDPDFYDRIDVDLTDEQLFPALRGGTAPDGWRRVEVPGWVNLRPTRIRIPKQGWKIHVSSTLDGAEEVSRRVWDYCVAHEVTFKLVPSKREYRRRISKYAERAGGGKLATIYPLDEEHLHQVLTELGDVLDGLPGPYILSDLRWRDGPLYVRYGAFLKRTRVAADGREDLAIEDPSGALVPDPRGAVFDPPAWVRLPEFLRPELDRRAAARVDDLPYEIVRVLHFSNGGGVYEGLDRRTGARVVLKEARPHTAVDIDNRDAVARLRRERDVLRRLRGLAGVPGFVGYHEIAGHEFLVEEFVEGGSLYRACARRNPLTRLGGAMTRAEFGRWVVRLWQRLADSVRAMHARGVVFGDLHQFNVLVSEDSEQLGLIDFEAGWFTEENRRQTMANPGFAAPSGWTGPAVDEYALAALKLAMFAPVTSLLRLGDGKVVQLAELVVSRYGVPEEWLADAMALLLEGATPAARPPRDIRVTAVEWPVLRSSISDAVLRSATPHRPDRLFPGDIAQFFDDGADLSLAHGAAGVLWALHKTGVEGFRAGERWLLDRATRDRHDDPPGFYTGRHGVAYALWDLGHRDAAVAVLDDEWRRPDVPDLGLFKGLSGMGLNWLRFARETGDDRYLRQAVRLADVVRDGIGSVTDVPETSGGDGGLAGLMLGSSGPAILLTEVFEETGEAAYLDAARAALGQDLRRSVLDEDGARQVNEGWRMMPYLASGSVGIGIAVDRYLRSRPDPELAARLAEIRLAAKLAFYLFPGLFHGRAGMILFNANHEPPGHPSLAAQVAGLDWQALNWHGCLTFPGSQLMRMSMDLATGSAGILLALAAARHSDGPWERRVSLPFLLPCRPPAPPCEQPAHTTARPDDLSTRGRVAAAGTTRSEGR